MVPNTFESLSRPWFLGWASYKGDCIICDNLPHVTGKRRHCLMWTENLAWVDSEKTLKLKSWSVLPSNCGISSEIYIQDTHGLLLSRKGGFAVQFPWNHFLKSLLFLALDGWRPRWLQSHLSGSLLTFLASSWLLSPGVTLPVLPRAIEQKKAALQCKSVTHGLPWFYHVSKCMNMQISSNNIRTVHTSICIYIYIYTHSTILYIAWAYLLVLKS